MNDPEETKDPEDMTDEEYAQAVEQYWKEVAEHQNDCVEILKHFKCDQCGWCCRAFPVMLSAEDVERISKRLGMNRQRFMYKYVEKIVNKVSCYLKNPCPFLQNKSGGITTCKVYTVRPSVCLYYPLSSNPPPKIVSMGKCSLAKSLGDRVKKIYEALPQENKRNDEANNKLKEMAEEDKEDNELLKEGLKDLNFQSKEKESQDMTFSYPMLKKLVDSVKNETKE